jgi:hypothetical protein
MKWTITEAGELKPARGRAKNIFTIPNIFKTKREAKIVRDLVKKM